VRGQKTLIRGAVIALIAHIGKKDIAYLHRIYRQSERASKNAILDVIERRAHGRLLDCGCGDGEFTVQVACRARVSEAYGIECVDDHLEEAIDRGVIVTKGDLNDPLPYKSCFFNIVHANQIIEQLLNIDLFLAEVKRVLRPDGYAILSIGNLASWRNHPPPPPTMEAVHLYAPNGITEDKAFDPLQGIHHPSEGDSRSVIFSSQDLARLCLYHGFWLERLTFAGYYPLMSQPMNMLDPVHTTILVARLRPIS
jgi:SAM-dependent methyltransferase